VDSKLITVKWQHPFVQTTLMFFSEMLCGVIYYSSKPKCSKWSERGKKKVSPLMFILPALLDSLGAACLYTGLSQIAASVYQMIRGFIVVVTASLTVVIFKRKLLNH
jgi:drug/metabolite transporter (DMT)-like permease